MPDRRRGPRTRSRVRSVGRLPSAALGLLFVVLYLPLGYLIYASVNVNPGSASWQGATTRWYDMATTDPAVRRAMWTSIRLAFLASLGATALGTMVALAVRRSTALKRLALGLAAARVATPEIIIATGLAVMLPLLDIALGFKPMLIAHIAYLAAYVVLIVGARAAGADISHEEAAMDLGASRFQVIRDIVLPDLRPAIVLSLLLTAGFSFDDVVLSNALRRAGNDTLPVYLFSAVQRRVTPAIHAIGVMVVIVGALTFVAAALVSRSTHAARTPHGTRVR